MPSAPPLPSSPEQHQPGRTIVVVDRTEANRKRCVATNLSIFMDVVLPFIFLILAIWNIFHLFSIKSLDKKYLGWVSLTIFFFPSILVFLYYAENMLHREKKWIEAVSIIAFGPLLRWFCNVYLLFARHDSLSENFRDLQAFATATSLIDGVFQGSVRIVWLLYLIATGVYPIPSWDIRWSSVTDNHHHQIQVPVLAPFGLYPALAVLVKNLFQYWRLHHPRATTEDGSTTVLVQEDATRSYK